MNIFESWLGPGRLPALHIAVRLGDLPSWLAALGTTGAFGVSLWLLRRQLLDRHELQRAARQAQARLVGAWTDRVVENDPPPRPALYAIVKNGSQQAIYNVAIRVEVGVRGTFTRQLGAMGPEEARELRIQLPGFPRGFDPIPDVMFTDSSGTTWIRTARTGDLAEPKFEDTVAFLEEDIGAYSSIKDHPTLNLPLSLEERRGRKL